MKDALGHGSEKRGGTIAHQEGVNQIGGRTPAVNFQNEVNNLSHNQTALALRIDSPTSVEIENIATDQQYRNQGFAGKLLKEITTLADQHGVTLRLDANPFVGTNEKRLGEFYKNNGFIIEPELAPPQWDRQTRMVRHPQKQ